MYKSNSPSTNPPQSGQSGEIHVMLVDDSAVIRGILTKILDPDPDINVVSSVSNGEHALSAAKSKKPHIIILDVEMPVMDGLTALPKLLEINPDTKVIMFSSLTESGATVTMQALSLGAVECLVKPSSNQDTGEGSQFQKNLLSLIKGLVLPHERALKQETQAAAIKPVEPPPPEKSGYTLRNNPGDYAGKPSIIAIGSSTGGPQALFEVIKHFGGFDIPIVITQHMPATFTRILAEHITQQTGVPCHEGEEGMEIEKGHAYVAPGGRHMKITQEETKLVVRLDDGLPENFCKPAVDPMLRSVIEIFDRKVMGVILTGMGHDGLNGCKLLAEKGGRLIAQDEESSVVWGMPGAVAQAGICNEVIPVGDIGPRIRKAVLG